MRQMTNNASLGSSEFMHYKKKAPRGKRRQKFISEYGVIHNTSERYSRHQKERERERERDW